MSTAATSDIYWCTELKTRHRDSFIKGVFSAALDWTLHRLCNNYPQSVSLGLRDYSDKLHMTQIMQQLLATRHCNANKNLDEQTERGRGEKSIRETLN